MTTQDALVIHAHKALTMDAPAPAPLDPALSDEALQERDRALTGYMEDVAILVEGGVVTSITSWRRRPKRAKRDGMIELEAALVTPAWVDAAARPIFAPVSHSALTRQSAQGATRGEVMRDAVQQTAAATRDATHNALCERLAAFSFDALRQGIAHVGVSTGYGLSARRELGFARVIEDVAREVPCDLLPVLTPGLVVPPDQRRDEHLAAMRDNLIPRAAAQGRGGAIELPVGPHALTADEAAELAGAARAHGWHVRVTGDLGGDMTAALALDADTLHLRQPLTDAQRAALAAANRPVVLSPTLHLLTARDAAPNLRALADAGVTLALSTGYDAELTTCPDITLAARGGVALGLTPGEALRAVTLGGALALGAPTLGAIRVGAPGHIAMFSAESPEALIQRFGAPQTEGLLWNGELVYWTEATEV